MSDLEYDLDNMTVLDLVEEMNNIKSIILRKEKEIQHIRTKINNDADEQIKSKKIEMSDMAKTYAEEYLKKKKELLAAYDLQKKRLDEKMYEEMRSLMEIKHKKCNALEVEYEELKNKTNEEATDKISKAEIDYNKKINLLKNDLKKMEEELSKRNKNDI